MSDGFRVSKDLELPRDSISWVITFIAKRGGGKTYNSADVVEEMVDKKVPVLVIDGMGIWWGLRTGVDKDGQPDPDKPGLPVVILGGNHADIKLDPAKVEKLVEALLQTNTSAVLDISQFRKGEQMRIAMVFAEELYRLADKYPAERVLVVEEADMFAPQKPFREEARCLGAFEDLVKRGGNRNIGLLLITQRSADFNKNLLTQSDCLMIGRTTAPQDKAAIQAWVEKHGEKDKKELEGWYDSLSGLKKGEVWVWNDDETFPIFKRVQFRKRRTFHATRKFVLTKQAANIKLMDAAEFIDKFKDKFEPKPKESLTPRPLTDIVPRPPPQPVVIREIMHPRVALTEHPLPGHEIQRIELPPGMTSEDLRTEFKNLPPAIRQSYPTLQIQRELANLVIPMALQEPTSPLGRLAVALASGAGPRNRDDSWTIKAFKERVSAHGWSEDGIDGAINQYIQWEIIQKLPSKSFKFNRDRIRIVDVPVEMQPE